MTLQPLAVLIVGACSGPRLGAASLLSYLALGAAGLPIFTPLARPERRPVVRPRRAGYLLAYPIAAYAWVGVAGDGRRWAGSPVAVLTGLAAINLAVWRSC